MPASTTNQSFEFPVGSSKHVGYLTRAPAGQYSLIGKSGIRLSFEIVGNGPFKGAAQQPDVTSVGLYFQRAGDDWSAAGPFEGYRFYSLDEIVPVRAGAFTLDVPLVRARWTSANTNAATEADFQAAIANAAAVGFTFGNSSGKGHGVYSEAPGSTFTVRGFDVY
jgi:hypothetical protein